MISGKETIESKISGNVFGYDAYMISDGSLRNVAEDGLVVGFSLQLRIANYRGYLLSQIEDVRLCVDGEWMPRDTLRFAVDGRSYTLDDMAEIVDDRWGLLDIALLTCRKVGGLCRGFHEITVEEHIRASYIPMVAVSSATRKMEVV